jgi:hypothetical protein
MNIPKSRKASRFWKFMCDGAGTTTVIFSIGAITLFAAAGSAIDFARRSFEQTRLQGVLDNALLSGVSTSINGDKQLAAANQYFKANAGMPAAKYSVAFSRRKSMLHGTVHSVIPTSLMAVVGIDEMEIEVQALATASISYEPLCFGAMNPTRKHTLELKDAVSVVAPDCNIYGNSNHTDDVVDPHTAENHLTARFIGAIGGGHHFLQNVQPQVEFGTELISDPLADQNTPAVGACDFNNTVIKSGHHVLHPGHYCGGLSISDDATVTLEGSDVFTISGGSFAVTDSKVTGNGTLIHLSGSAATIDWQEATIKLSAKPTGNYAGFAIVGDRVPTNNEINQSKIDIHGAFYMPKGAFTWINSGDFSPSAMWSAFVVDGVSWQGSGVIRYNFNLAASPIPYPQALVSVPRPGNARLLE